MRVYPASEPETSLCRLIVCYAAIDFESLNQQISSGVSWLSSFQRQHSVDRQHHDREARYASARSRDLRTNTKYHAELRHLLLADMIQGPKSTLGR